MSSVESESILARAPVESTSSPSNTPAHKPRPRPIRIEIRPDGTVYGWCKDLRALGFPCEFPGRDCSGCFCG